MVAAALKEKRWQITIVVLLALIVAGWHWGLRAPVITYGHPSKSYFKPAEGSPGDTIQICFDDVVWHRVCPSVLSQYFTPAKGPRIDTVYAISVPPRPGRVPPKCRPWKIPDLTDDQLGLGTLSGHVTSQCWPLDHWQPIIETLPPMKLLVRR